MKRFVQNKLNNKIEPMFSRQGVFIDQLFRAILAPQIGHQNQNPSVKMVVLTF